MQTTGKRVRQPNSGITHDERTFSSRADQIAGLVTITHYLLTSTRKLKCASATTDSDTRKARLAHAPRCSDTGR